MKYQIIKYFIASLGLITGIVLIAVTTYGLVTEDTGQGEVFFWLIYVVATGGISISIKLIREVWLERNG